VLFRKTLKNYLLHQKNIGVVLQASDIPELLDKLTSSMIDILIMDLMMPGINDADAVTLLRARYPSIRILVLSMCTDVDMVSDLLESGINGYIACSDEPEELVQAIYAAAENRLYRNGLLMEALYWNKQNTVNLSNYPEGYMINLNEREKKILCMIWEEKTNKEIAEELFLGVRSIEKIRQSMKDKIAVKSTIGLIKYAIDKRIIRVEERSSEVNR
jgi:DNA-binding NarL/FixJ family response regulator